MTPAELYARCPTLAYGASKADCREYVRTLVRLIGVGFHPDTAAADYVGPDGARTFTDSQADALQRSLDRAHGTLGDDIYDVALLEMHKLAAG